MKIGRMALWVGLIIFGILAIWGTPITIKNPSGSNIAVNAIFFIIIIVILYFLFFRRDGNKRQQVEATSEIPGQQ
jgi:uncharacterized membrane protein (DUF373 family)